MDTPVEKMDKPIEKKKGLKKKHIGYIAIGIIIIVLFYMAFFTTGPQHIRWKRTS